MAEVTRIRRQPSAAAPAPAAAPPPTPAAPPPDGSIRFAVSKTMIVVGVLTGIVLALLLYLSGFFTAVALLLAPEAPSAASRPAAQISAPAAPPAPEAKASVPSVSKPPAVPAKPSASATTTQGSAEPRAAATPETETSQTPAPAAEDGQAAQPPSQADAGKMTSEKPAPEQPAAAGAAAPAVALPPVPAEIADRQDLRIAPDGRITGLPAASSGPAIAEPGEKSAPPSSGVAAAPSARPDAPTDVSARPGGNPERQIPANLPETRQLPATRQNVLLAPPPAAPRPAEDEPAWSLQVGAFLDQAHAEKLVSILSERGYQAYILASRDRQGRNWQRVRLGRYASREDAAEAALQFRRKEGREVIPVRRLIDRAGGN